jgi:predicted nucleic acid-binding protein
MRRLRVYADTSVFGGCFDPEFKLESRKFFDEVRQGRFTLLISNVTLAELQSAPEDVRRVLADLPADQVELVEASDETEALRQAYLEAGIVGPLSSNDAAHVAAATTSGADIVVSWNFKHIVHFEKIAGFEGVNLLRGFRSPRIYSPREVVEP